MKNLIQKGLMLLTSVLLFSACGGGTALPECPNGRVRTAHVGVGGMGKADLSAIASHKLVDVVALCDVDATALNAAHKNYPKAKIYKDYRIMLKEMENEIDAVIVSTPDHTHAPVSMMAMEMGKAVYCQKPLTHHISESRAMAKLANQKGIVTQMGIQVHSFYDYKLATYLIQSDIIGKVKYVKAWSPKNWGYDGKAPKGVDKVPATLDWNLWLGTSEKKPYKADFYHPGNWRKLLAYGCGTLGDMGVHIFDTPYNALQLGVPSTVKNNCRKPTGVGFPLNNTVTYEFPKTQYTSDNFKWIWYDGPGAPTLADDLKLPNNQKLPEQGAMFIGEKGRLLLPHFMERPRLIVDGKYKDMKTEITAIENEFGIKPDVNYDVESQKHYHEFINACLGKTICSAPFSYSARLTEVILLGTIAGRFPGEKLHWDAEKAKFSEEKANKLLDAPYREF